MARRGRPKKGGITYDSKETKFLLAVLAFAFGVFALLSYVISEEAGVFGFLRTLFGNITPLFGIFFINLALALFGAKFFATSKKSLLSQLIISLLLSIIVASNADPLIWKASSYRGDLGGIIGYEAANFSQQNILLNLTTPVAWIILVLLLPSTFSQSIAEFFTMIAKGIGGFYTWLFSVPEESKDDRPLPVGGMAKTAMFGDFRNRDQNVIPMPIKPRTEIKPENPDFVGLNNRMQTTNTNQVNTSTSMVSKEGPVVQTELKYPHWKLPPLDLLNPLPKIETPKEDVKNNSTIIEQTLASFGIESKVMDVMIGPSVTQYALDIALGIKVSKISNLRNDLALALATSANSVRVEVPIAGTSYVGIEIPNTKRQPVFFREMIATSAMSDPKYALAVTVGKGIAGNHVLADIQKMPHLLIAGTTGSGKSVLTNSFIMSMLMKLTPDQVRLILVDPKQVELSDYNGIPHLLTPVITEMDKVTNALKWSVAEMERRYTIFHDARVKNLEGYNQQQGFYALPYIVIVIDEMADMMLTAGRPEIETNIVRLAQKARATGVHLILATQRPSVNVITGLIKANIPGRVGMSVTTNIDSRVILDTVGAESLLGKGDMLFKEPDKNTPYRVQGVLITQEEIQRVVNYIREQAETVEYIEDIITSKDANKSGLGGEGNANGLPGDTLFADAMRIIVSSQKGSASLLQRKLAIGYNRAAKLLDEMEEVGVVGPANGAKPRDVLITDAEGFLAQLAEMNRN